MALTDEKESPCKKTFNAVLTVKDALWTFSNKPELVPMTAKAHFNGVKCKLALYDLKNC